MVEPIEGQQYAYKQRMAQHNVMNPQTRHGDEREHIVARHVEVVVEERPEAHVCAPCEAVEVVVYEQDVEQCERDECRKGEPAFVFPYA